MKTWVAFWTLAIVYGSSFMFVDIAVDQLAPLEITFIRLAIGAICLTIFLQLTRTLITINWWFIRSATIVGVFNIVIPSLLIAWAQEQDVGSGLSGVLVATNPLFAMVIAHLAFHDDRMTPPKIAGVIFGFVGAAILASRNWEGGSLDVDGLIAQGAIMMAALFFAFTSSFSRYIMQYEVPPLLLATGSMIAAAIITGVLFALAILFGQSPIEPSTWQTDTIMVILELGFIHSFMAFPLMFFIIREMGVTRSSMITYIIPVVSLMMGAIFLDETIDGRVLIGTAVILSSIGIVNLGKYLFKASPIPAATLVIGYEEE